MDNGILNELMKKIGTGEQGTPEAVEDFINKNLTPSQAHTVNRILSDPETVNRLMQSEQARKLMQRLSEKGE